MGSVGAMDSRPLRSIALDLASLDLTDRDGLVGLLATHAVAPTRRLYGMPSPVPGETPDMLEPSVGPLQVSTALFDPLIRGYVLFSRLLPTALRTYEGLETILSVPNWAYFDRSRQLRWFLWRDLENLVDGLLGREASGPDHPCLESRYVPTRNDAGMAELASARELVLAALATPVFPDDPAYRVRNIGLRSVDQGTAFRLDEVLRAEVHQRLVWFADVDITFPIGYVANGPTGEPMFVSEVSNEPLEIVDDHGTYPTVVPETIAGVVALDLVSTFSRDRSVGICEHCRRPLLLTPQQAGRVQAGRPVYHPDCFPEHRVRWIRDFQRQRRAGGRP